MADLKPGEFLIASDIETEVVDDPNAGDGRGTANPGDIEAYTLALGPATTADLLELDAVPEPTDSDAPSDIHARTLARART
jgi:hypothetical protein